MAPERIAVNTPIQGSAADIVKLAMLRVVKRLKEERLLTRLILQFTTSSYSRFPTVRRRRLRADSEGNGEGLCPFSPLRVSIEIGDSWGEFH
jgi:DNA polymerase-1